MNDLCSHLGLFKYVQYEHGSVCTEVSIDYACTASELNRCN